MKRLIVMLTAGLAMLALGACGKEETKPQEGKETDTATQQQAQPAEEKKAEEQKPSAQADQYDRVAQATMDEAAPADAAKAAPGEEDENKTKLDAADAAGTTN